MSIFVFYVLISAVAALILARAAWTWWGRVVKLQEVLAGTREDLIQQIRAVEHFRTAAEHASDGIIIQELNGLIIWANPAYCRIMGLPKDQILGRNPLEFALPENVTMSREEIAAFRYDPRDYKESTLRLFRNRRGDGTEFWNQINVSIRKLPNGDVHAILVCRDVTKQIEDQDRLRETQSQLEYAASHDMLTGVANRAELMRYCEEALGKAGEQDEPLGMLHIDLDKFKEINDTHGHSIGDAVLESVAHRIGETITVDGLVARIGGDEFVVVCEGPESLPKLAKLGERLCKKISQPLQLDDVTFRIECSVGAALAAPDCTGPEELMVQSDFALYEAKRRGRNQVAIYDEGLHRRHSAEVRRASQLRDAIYTDQFVRHFQPTFDMSTGRVSGFETLVRWVRPDGSKAQPDEFLRQAEMLGLMGDLDLASMSAALDMKDRLTWAGWPDLRINFNASSELLLHPDFIARLIRGVETRRIDRSHVVIEILETTMFGSPNSTGREAEVIADLREAGFRVMLDDFGTGYAGLGHLTGLAVSGVKLDRALASQVIEDAASARVADAILKLCHDLDLDVVAEGVETRELAEALYAMGCPVMQGFWIGHPMPAAEAIEWLREGPRTIEPLRSAI